MLKKISLKFKIIFLSIFVSSISYADLIKPKDNIEPYKVVKIQLNGLKQNDKPTKDIGIKQTWEFAHPNNQKYTGPLDKFISMLKSDSYEMLLNHINHEIIEIKTTNSQAFFQVTVMDKKKTYYRFNWQVEKYTKDGPLKDCWLTTMVSAPMPLGSSI